jgi:predicted transglutaminase-like cysteine proteinase
MDRSHLIQSPARSPESKAAWFSEAARHLKRWVLKGLVFAALTLIVLNPNLKRAWLQIQHTLHPEGLIQTRFPSLPVVNEQLDRFVAADHARRSEARLVARFVLQNIKYVTDYANWGNLEYWPTPQEVWDKRQEDCDGRAILTARLLRARGFSSAHLVVGLDHMWICVDENEKAPATPPHYIALLNPDPNFSLDLGDEAQPGDLARILRALLHPTALKETGTHLFADIPALRKAILIVALVFLCLHPHRPSTVLLALSALGLAAVALLMHWQPENGPSLQASLGGLLLFLSVAGAMVAHQVLWRMTPRLAQAE